MKRCHRWRDSFIGRKPSPKSETENPRVSYHLRPTDFLIQSGDLFQNLHTVPNLKFFMAHDDDLISGRQALFYLEEILVSETNGDIPSYGFSILEDKDVILSFVVEHGELGKP